MDKLTLISHMSITLLFVGMAAWCGKNYRALKNIQHDNEHRVAAIKSANAIKDATEFDNETRRSIFLEMIKLAFSHTSSGYSSGGDSGINISSILNQTPKS